MKKTVKIIALLVVALVAVAAISFFIACRPVKLSFAKSISITYEASDGNKSIEITDENDVKRLAELCEGTALNTGSIPSCGFGAVKMVFKGDVLSQTLFPACDSCSTMRAGYADTLFYDISDSDRDELEEILEKYDIHFPCI